ncbi:Ldh family oxidoreductase [Oceaniovalibus sp. ACAM 378]|uniref:Ldh family oxidoreductase n=1 Tax=Oceaniovalibus sp. ACAM 378 TaxID=2599923 RepID=UPI0011D5ECDE|nr:Ldh family oxidoreductase [Oceaniovalibus sp. ACAM 378]TYB85373.1 Ldh family oxidoreductase [Oceaniovalibus sp. ACAM 378]
MTGVPPTRIAQPKLEHFIRSVFVAAGLRDDLAADVAEVLIEADMMGHATHGVALVPMYLKSLESGGMAKDGEIEVLADMGACATWTCHRLPGATVLKRAMDLAIERAKTFGCSTVSITDSYHMGALAVYLVQATQQGMMAVLSSSTLSSNGVAPFGGTVGVMTPNPIAAGIPTSGDPILLDISASITTRNKSLQYAAAGQRFPGQWALDVDGNPSDDPNALLDGGTLLPIGGLDHGHKGYALGLMVEALTQGFSGIGRNDEQTGTYTTGFLQVFDPRAFAGKDAFTRTTDHLVKLCQNNHPRAGVDKVRVPGENALARRRAALKNGVDLSGQIMQGLAAAAEQTGVKLPDPVVQRLCDI